PPAYECLNADSPARAVLICDHASNRVPAVLNDLGLDHQARNRHIAWDMGAGKMTRFLARYLNVPAVLAGYSRLVMDLNRLPDTPDAYPEVSDFTVIPGNQGLSQEDRDLRRRSLFEPYHGAIERQLDQVRARGERPALVAIHSYTQELLAGGGQRPWHIGVLYEKDPRIARGLLKALSMSTDVQAGDNQPYSGAHEHDYSVDTHGEAAGIACCGIEVRQDLLATAQSFHYWATILGDALAETLADERIYAPPTSEA
ncbi:MAG: N-formylglutamate amidohydrolase, partial [Pseudomonadota bacterium]